MRRMITVIVLALLFSQYVGATSIAIDVSHEEGTVALVSPIVDPTTGRVVAEGIIPTSPGMTGVTLVTVQNLGGRQVSGTSGGMT